MSPWTIVRRSLRHYWRISAGVLAGSALATAVIVGALLVGDSVRGSLRDMAVQRLGATQYALGGGDRFFRAALADDLQKSLAAPVAPLLALRGMLSAPDGSGRLNQVQVLGVDSRFWSLGEQSPATPEWDDQPQETAFLNAAAARALNANPGDELILRATKPSYLPNDAPLGGKDDSAISWRIRVEKIVPDRAMGRFSLQANQVAPANVFVPLRALSAKVKLSDRANLLLAGAGHSPISLPQAQAAVAGAWQLADANLAVRELPGDIIEVRSDRVFLDPPAAAAVRPTAGELTGVLTYFVNEIRCGSRSTPYSMVAAMGPLRDGGLAASAPATVEEEYAPSLGSRPSGGAGQDLNYEIAINEWLAGDLQAKAGDFVELKFFVLSPAGALVEKSSSFRVQRIVPVQGVWTDRSLMPDFPGLADTKSCRQWRPGVPIDVKKIRKQDEQYWEDYKGTPKAYVSLSAGRKMWGNRFGNLTAIRWVDPAAKREAVERAILSRLAPADVGLYFSPVREQALKASSQGQDMGQLFLGLGFFLVVAALLLAAMLFGFGVEQRASQVGILRALGLTSRQAGGILLREGVLLAALGGLLGLAGGLAYTWVMIVLLTTVWRGAVGSSDLAFHAEPATMLLGTAAGMIVSLGAIWLVSRRLRRFSPRELLAGELGAGRVGRSAGRGSLWLAVTAAVGAVVLLAMSARTTGENYAMTFFGAGFLLLVAGLALVRRLLGRLARAQSAAAPALAAVAIRNTVRRPWRSLGTVAMVACGSFLVVAVGAFWQGGGQDLRLPASPSGGFDLMAESSLPIRQNLENPDQWPALGLALPEDTKILALRSRTGDDASCLNLNRPQQPRLLGVPGERLDGSGCFTFTANLLDPDHPWLTLARRFPDGAIPAVADQNTVAWAMGKSLGDVVPYTDERGRSFSIRIAGILAGSTLQGSLLIDRTMLTELYPSQTGYNVLLVRAPEGQERAVSQTLSRAMEDYGLQVTRSADRLDELAAVENTYLSIFQVLGGLGLLLGIGGLSLVLLRNVLQRRSELALLRAVGFSRQRVGRLILIEHAALGVAGLACGVAAAVVAVWPALAGGHMPWRLLALELLAIAANGVLWVYLAGGMALRGRLLPALRSE